MAVTGCQLNRFERILFKVALLLAGLLIVVRVGVMLLLTFFHHSR